MAEETVLIRFKGEDDASKTADSVNAKISDIEQSAGKAGSSFSTMGSIMTGVLQGVGQKLGSFALDLGGKALGAVTDFISGSITEAASWQSAMAQTEAVVKSTGAAAGLTASQMGDMAAQMSAASGKSIFSDDAILGAENVLATFTQIKGQSFTGATQAVLDMSQALGTDLQSASIQVGKALNDPVAGITALSRAGVTFSDDQKAVIQAMVDTGNIAGAQKIILDELGKEFGGSAAAAVNTYAGQQIVLKEKLADVQQTLGEALLPVLVTVGSWIADTLVPILAEGVTSLSEWITSWTDLDDVLLVLVTTWDALTDAYNAVTAAGETAGQGLQSFLTWLQPIIDAAQNFGAVLVPIMQQAGAAITEYLASPVVQSLLTALMALFGALATLVQTVLVAAFNTAAASWSFLAGVFTQYWPQIQTVLNTLVSAVTIAVNLVTGILTALSQLLKGDFSGAWTTTKTTIGTAIDSIWKFCQDLYANVSGFVGDIVGKFKEIGTQIAEGIATGISDAAESIKSAAMTAAQNAYQAVKDFFGIASPSRLMHDMVGVNISRGIATGIMSGIPEVTTAADLAAASGAQTVNNYNFSASYANTQSESSLIGDARALMVSLGAM